MLNRRPLDLPPLDSDVPMIRIIFKHYSSQETREQLRKMPNLLYNKYSGWYFDLSSKGIWKMTHEHESICGSIHLSAVANLNTLVAHSILGYSKLEPERRINSFGREVPPNADIKANHRFYAGAWIDNKPYSVRMMIREYYDGRVALGEEAKAYALNVKEMRDSVFGTSESPASHGLTTAHKYESLIKDNMSGISEPSSRCEPAPPTDIPLTGTKIVQGERKSKSICDLPNRSLSHEHEFIKLQNLIESNLKAGEESLYRQRAAFDYSKTGTDRLETLFDRMGLSAEQRTSIYHGDKVLASGVRIHNERTDVVLSFENGRLTYQKLHDLKPSQQNRPTQQPQPGNRHLKF